MNAPLRSAEVVTFGCRLNAVESQELAKAHASARETIVVNTCAVTGEATRQARQSIRRLRRERPDAEIIVAGCAARLDPQGFAKIDGVTRVLAEHAPNRALAGVEGTRGLLAIQNGCDHRCTFCIIPFGRGVARSAAPSEIVAQARALIAGGKKEIVLTGVDLTSYGVDLGEGWTLGRLARLLLRELPALERLRLSSVDCIEIDDDLIAAFADDSRLCPHLHLSLQSGDD
ncbi:MAG: radical SAM protein, partial [Alphaproteobacteria bacterium]|nr:radical SAM protein [Alphaproteobacteria bacterium]